MSMSAVAFDFSASLIVCCVLLTGQLSMNIFIGNRKYVLWNMVSAP